MIFEDLIMDAIIVLSNFISFCAYEHTLYILMLIILDMILMIIKYILNKQKTGINYQSSTGTENILFKILYLFVVKTTLNYVVICLLFYKYESFHLRFCINIVIICLLLLYVMMHLNAFSAIDTTLIYVHNIIFFSVIYIIIFFIVEQIQKKHVKVDDFLSFVITIITSFFLDYLFLSLTFIFSVEKNQKALINKGFYLHTTISIIYVITRLLFNYTSDMIHHLPIALCYIYSVQKNNIMRNKFNIKCNELNSQKLLWLCFVLILLINTLSIEIKLYDYKTNIFITTCLYSIQKP
jgi:hypothetical protein